MDLHFIYTERTPFLGVGPVTSGMEPSNRWIWLTKPANRLIGRTKPYNQSLWRSDLQSIDCCSDHPESPDWSSRVSIERIEIRPPNRLIRGGQSQILPPLNQSIGAGTLKSIDFGGVNRIESETPIFLAKKSEKDRKIGKKLHFLTFLTNSRGPFYTCKL